MSKFDCELAENLYEFTPNEEIGSVQELGWFGLYKGNRDRRGRFAPNVILSEDSQGFVDTITPWAGETIDDVWKEIVDEYSVWYSNGGDPFDPEF